MRPAATARSGVGRRNSRAARAHSGGAVASQGAHDPGHRADVRRLRSSGDHLRAAGFRRHLASDAAGGGLGAVGRLHRPVPRRARRGRAGGALRAAPGHHRRHRALQRHEPRLRACLERAVADRSSASSKGVGLGAEVPIANTYINEIARSDVRGRFYILYQTIFAFGLIAAGLLGYLMVPTIGWQSMFYLGTRADHPGLLHHAHAAGIAALAGRQGAARRGRHRRRRDRARRDGARARPAAAGAVARRRPRQASRWGEIFEGIYRHRTFSVWAMWFCCFSTTYGLQAWLPTLYRTNFHLPLAQSLLYGLITQCCGIFGSVLCALTVDRTGRRPWFVVAFAGRRGDAAGARRASGPARRSTLLVFVSVGALLHVVGGDRPQPLHVRALPDAHPRLRRRGRRLVAARRRRGRAARRGLSRAALRARHGLRLFRRPRPRRRDRHLCLRRRDQGATLEELSP